MAKQNVKKDLFANFPVAAPISSLNSLVAIGNHEISAHDVRKIGLAITKPCGFSPADGPGRQAAVLAWQVISVSLSADDSSDGATQLNVADPVLYHSHPPH